MLLMLQRMRPDYKDHYRASAVGYILSFAARLSIVDDYAHDAVLLMDRAMSTCMQVLTTLFSSLYWRRRMIENGFEGTCDSIF